MGLRASSIPAALLLALAGCAHDERPRSAEPPPAPASEVTTAPVVRTRTEGTVPLPAVVQARQRAALASRLVASVTALPYQEGDRVAAGAVVARLDDAALRGALAAAEAGAGAAEADLHRAQALLAKAAATPRELEQA
ncbi:MAG TPA: biotin/lipoyl-binding protein, partial [Vicinamibacteria bacterium]